MDNMAMAQTLSQFITAELTDAAYCRELARSAPSDADYQMLLNMADNDQEQAENFKKLYRACTGRNSNATAAPITFSGTYEDALRQQALNESAACFTYAQQYVNAQNTAFRKACFCAAATANMHCQQLLAMLTQDNTASPNVLSAQENR